MCGFRRYATSRAATLAGVFTSTVFGFMRAYAMVVMFGREPLGRHAVRRPGAKGRVQR